MRPLLPAFWLKSASPPPPLPVSRGGHSNLVQTCGSRQVERRDGGEVKVNYCTPSQHDSWALRESQIDHARHWIVFFLFLGEKNTFKGFFHSCSFWLLIRMAAKWCGDSELCRRIITQCGVGVREGEGSAPILLPAGWTCFPLDRSLNAALDFRDAGSVVAIAGAGAQLIVSPATKGNWTPANFSSKFDFWALLGLTGKKIKANCPPVRLFQVKSRWFRCVFYASF